MGLFNKTKKERPKAQKNVTLYGINCSYDAMLNSIKKYFSNYEIKCNGDFITININGNIVSVNTSKSSDENYYKAQANGMCHFWYDISLDT